MLIRYGLFDSTTQDERVYAADQVAVIFRALSLSGVVDLDTCLKITAAGDGMKVNMAPGSALVSGYMMDAIDDGGGVYQLLFNAGGSQARVDRVVVRLDLSSDSRTVLPSIKQGTPSGTPVAPALTRSGEIYEISLAQVYIAAGATAITAANITDERGDENTCGVVLPKVLKLSTLGSTHVHSVATTAAGGFMSASQVALLSGAVASTGANASEIASLKSRVATLESAVSALQATVSAHAAQLAGLTSASTPAFKGMTLSGTLNMGSNYIDNALFK